MGVTRLAGTCDSTDSGVRCVQSAKGGSADGAHFAVEIKVPREWAHPMSPNIPIITAERNLRRLISRGESG